MNLACMYIDAILDRYMHITYSIRIFPSSPLLWSFVMELGAACTICSRRYVRHFSLFMFLSNNGSPIDRIVVSFSSTSLRGNLRKEARRRSSDNSPHEYGSLFCQAS